MFLSRLCTKVANAPTDTSTRGWGGKQIQEDSLIYKRGFQTCLFLCIALNNAWPSSQSYPSEKSTGSHPRAVGAPPAHLQVRETQRAGWGLFTHPRASRFTLWFYS